MVVLRRVNHAVGFGSLGAAVFAARAVLVVLGRRGARLATRAVGILLALLLYFRLLLFGYFNRFL